MEYYKSQMARITGHQIRTRASPDCKRTRRYRYCTAVLGLQGGSIFVESLLCSEPSVDRCFCSKGIRSGELADTLGVVLPHDIVGPDIVIHSFLFASFTLSLETSQHYPQLSDCAFRQRLAP